MYPQIISELKWVSSPSSPIILLPRSLSRHWTGRGEQFDRAQSGTEPLFQIPVAHGSALVLEDGFHTTWWPIPELSGDRGKHAGGLLVRWLWARSDEEVIRAVRQLPLSHFETENMVFDAGDGTALLFEASHPAMSSPNEIPIFLTPGRYAIMTANVEPDPHTCLIVHRLQLIS